jgi:integrase/recombinase XerD
MTWLRPGRRKKSRLKERRDPIVLPEHAHIQLVIDAAPGLFAKLILAALKTGARQKELQFGKRTQFNSSARQYTIIGKRNKRRTIDLEDGGDDFGFEAFAGLPATIEGPWLFWHRDEARGREEQPVTPYMQVSSNFARLVRSVARQAQKQAQDFRPFTFHHLRHRAAVDWLKSGRSIYVLQQRLGHTTIQMTEKYLEFLTHEEKLRVTLQRQEKAQKQAQKQRFKNEKSA